MKLYNIFFILEYNSINKIYLISNKFYLINK